MDIISDEKIVIIATCVDKRLQRKRSRIRLDELARKCFGTDGVKIRPYQYQRPGAIYPLVRGTSIQREEYLDELAIAMDAAPSGVLIVPHVNGCAGYRKRGHTFCDEQHEFDVVSKDAHDTAGIIHERFSIPIIVEVAHLPDGFLGHTTRVAAIGAFADIPVRDLLPQHMEVQRRLS